MSSEIFHVSPWDVVIPQAVPPVDVERQMRRLEDEGQIEPIVLDINHQPDLDEWAYADAQVVAARVLKWPTILVVYS